MAQQTQRERVQFAVETAEEAIKAANGDVLSTTADEAAEAMGYEPASREMTAFRKAWGARQEELEEELEGDDSADLEPDEEAELGEASDEIDPFADDDDELPPAPKMADRRAVAIDRARDLLGDEADTASPEEAIMALRYDPDGQHEFYVVMRGSTAQTNAFKRDFRKTQPDTGNSTSARISRRVGFKDELAKMRGNLSTVRKTTEKGEAIRMLEEVRELAEDLVEKIDAAEEA